MKYTYDTVTGDIEVELDEHWHQVLIAMDREDFNSDRKQKRRHLIRIDHCIHRGAWFVDRRNAISEIDFALDLEQMLSSLTELQRTCFVETRMYGKNQQQMADELGRAQPTVRKAAEGAAERLKKNL